MKRALLLAALPVVASLVWLYLAIRDSSRVWLRVVPDSVPKRDYLYETRLT